MNYYCGYDTLDLSGPFSHVKYIRAIVTYLVHHLNK